MIGVKMSQGIKPAQQARSRATRDKLVAALDRLLRTRSFESLTIADLAAEAGLAVGTVYRRFENKDAFIPVIFELYMARLDEFMAGAGRVEIEPDEGLRKALHRIVRSAWGLIEREGHLVRAAHLYARLRPDLVGDDWRTYLDAALNSTRQIIGLFDAEVRVKDREAAAQMLAYLLNTLPLERGLYPEEGVSALLTLEDEPFLEALADTMYGYLTTGP
jgi:AcrR family transcriptional regulator